MPNDPLISNSTIIKGIKSYYVWMEVPSPSLLYQPLQAIYFTHTLLVCTVWSLTLPYSLQKINSIFQLTMITLFTSLIQELLPLFGTYSFLLDLLIPLPLVYQKTKFLWEVKTVANFLLYPGLIPMQDLWTTLYMIIMPISLQEFDSSSKRLVCLEQQLLTSSMLALIVTPRPNSYSI